MGLELQIKKNLGEFHLDLDLQVDNEVFALLGASGCGKSMTLRCIAGIVTPDEGKIVLNDRVLFDSEKKINLSPKERNVGFLFQNYALFPNMTVAQNIATGVRGNKNPKAVKDMMERLYLTEQENHYPYQLSGGQQQRVALGRLLISEPEILLLDEPFSALDSYLKWQLEQELMDILEEVSLTTLFVSHNRDEVYRLCDRIGVIQNGTLSSVDEKVSLFENPKTLSAALLSGCKNISRVKIVDGRVQLLDWGVTLQPSKQPENGTLYAGIRAHYFYEAMENDTNAFPCVVTRVVEDIFTTSLILTSETAPFDARRDYSQIMWKLSQQQGTKERVKYKVGDKLFLGVSPEDVLLLTE